LDRDGYSSTVRVTSALTLNSDDEKSDIALFCAAKFPNRAMSALPPKADIGTRSRNVRFVPKADILHCGKERRYSITSSAAC